ncbi:hypothetical protein BCR44DRAFT_1295516 [Catenaria anguillulae PL171]|uniref:Uncharacterized protein n=1 Tax=Catenaria anguillulae PL171 TaxID=765915 RepID=A0A1Y2HVE3_9FUNG|nr:hypothetical protein BCR44DRAFT_1295516 [Catenaria anguillulae PL171]
MMQQHAKQRAKHMAPSAVAATATQSMPTPSVDAPEPTLPHKLGHMPSYVSSPLATSGPKLTATTIMRETAMHKKREAAADKALAHALMGLVDPDQVREAEAEARRAVHEEREAELRRLRISVQLAKEEAGIQREVAVKEKQIAAQQVKSDLEARIADFELAQRELDAANRARVAEVQDLSDRVALAKSRVAEEKHRLAREAAAEAERQRQDAARRAAQDLEERRELIRQIRALEAATVALVGVSGRQMLNGANVVDLTSSSNVGLLTEMSIVELQERLIQTRAVAKAAEDKRRDEIAKEKAEKSEQLQKSMDYVQQARARVSAANSRGSGASTSGSGAGGNRSVASALGQAASRLQTLSEVEEMERKLADKRKEKLKLIASNSASPHRYRVRIKHIEKPVSRPPTPPISVSLPNLSIHGGLADNTWNKVDLRKHVPLLKLRKVVKYPSAPELTTIEGADDDEKDQLDGDGKPKEPKKLEGRRLTDAIAMVLRLDKVVG